MYMIPRPATARTPSSAHFALSAIATIVSETAASPMPRPVRMRTCLSTASTNTPKPLRPSARWTRSSRLTLIAIATICSRRSGTMISAKMLANSPEVSETSRTSNAIPVSAPVSHGNTKRRLVWKPARRSL
jgi:hypothetical protein